ncbi:uncharacterized protein PV06_05924 [Exophiala oligosperma]|uniref:Mid2 domain-containing protein n=1 Tax=Exophiala oligosperma TaxID=215243 RepID=A0A0D2DIT1_9EURO|nr:uncharacterized protein PV06_05924 [Exophiala oligosperma]KIW42365.1 hypothetical protein PV06_05924 [Exophiala oligosperma]
MYLFSSPSGLWLLWTTSVILSSASAFGMTFQEENTLFQLGKRDDLSCAAVDPKLPSDFKCPSGTSCISLDNSSSGLCCPDNNNCSNIQIVSCNIQTQNLTANANAAIFTTKLSDKLPTCGDGCCPFGYECILSPDGKNVCNLIASTSKTNVTASSVTTSTASKSSASSTSTPTSTGLSSAVSQTSNCNKFPVGVFLAGFFPGMFVGAFLMLAWVICSGRHRKPARASRSSTSSTRSTYKPTISDPIPLGSPSGGLRTDFLRRTTGRAKSIFSTKSQVLSGNSTSHWKMPTPPVPNNVPNATCVPAPVTPDRTLRHELSSESIHVFSPQGNEGVPQPIPAHIAPLRGMSAQRYNPNASNTSMGSPFQSPPKADNMYSDQMARSNIDTQSRGLSTYSAVSSLHDRDGGHEPETLPPARYEPTVSPGHWSPSVTKRVRIDGAAELESRPTTTFTEMLHEAGFPDPLNGHGTPAVPKIPKIYGSGRL